MWFLVWGSQGGLPKSPRLLTDTQEGILTLLDLSVHLKEIGPAGYEAQIWRI